MIQIKLTHSAGHGKCSINVSYHGDGNDDDNGSDGRDNEEAATAATTRCRGRVRRRSATWMAPHRMKGSCYQKKRKG